MTILFPRLGSPQLEPYEAPFGRMMLAFARATAAVIELVIQVQGKGEAEVVRFVTTAGTKDLPKKLRRLFKNKLDKEQDAKLRQVADEYKRWVKPISPRTGRRQLNIIQGVFQAAIEYRDGFSSLPNHFRGIRVQGSIGGRRERSLEGDELERILKACEKCRIPNNYYVPLAIHLGIDTGMRRQEERRSSSPAVPGRRCNRRSSRCMSPQW